MQTAKGELCPHFRFVDAVLLENKQIAQEFLPLSIQGCTEDDGEEFKRNSFVVKGYNVRENASVDVRALSARQRDIRVLSL